MATIPWLADVLRAAGVGVVEHGDWRNRMVSGSFNPIGVLWHHTAARSSASNPHPALNTCIYGRPDLPGPLCQALVDYHGVFHLISAGRANHAGASRGSGPIPAGDGNTMLVGWEIDYDGVNQRMTAAQYDASLAATAAVLRQLGRDAGHARGHRETSTSGKIDPSFIDLDLMRADVAARLSGGGGVAGRAFQFGDSQRVVAVGTGGQLVNLSWAPGRGVVRADWGGGPLTGRAVGYAHANQQHVFARGTDNTLRHLWYGPGMATPGVDNWNTAGRVLSNPTGFAYGSQQHVFYRNPDGHLEHRFYDLNTRQIAGGVWPGGAFVGNPHAFVHRDQQHIFGRTAGGGLIHWFWWPGIDPATDDWAVTAGVASDPSGFSYAGNQHHVFFRNSAGDLQHRFFDDPSGTLNGGVWPGGGFVGSPHAFVHRDQQHVFGRAAGGDLRHWYWWPGIEPGTDNWGAVGVVADDPVGLSTANQHHVFYRIADGTLEHRFFEDTTGRLTVDNWGGSLAP
ncbi:N-acetylmuramoyl-L-alanine amidase [Micromonospora sp. NPDC126480]|uniref:N-acetylmuramoyl-L-alanine amidase n=1 Tax=Micromonospora sp. NPDC126480 TaxID=3155312 RepID=UPI00331ABC50